KFSIRAGGVCHYSIPGLEFCNIFSCLYNNSCCISAGYKRKLPSPKSFSSFPVRRIDGSSELFNQHLIFFNRRQRNLFHFQLFSFSKLFYYDCLHSNPSCFLSNTCSY